ncbi:RidA family protein [Xanthobacter sp. VNH20]|uniref:RidA family protein n=1 Tax=Xanthobacter sp. VNH20 TaxID=3156616 RepID=UPI0032B6139B
MITRYDSNNRYSKAVVAGGFVFLAGLTAEDCSLGIEEQTASVLKQIDDYLERAGSSKEKMVSVNIWLTSMSYAGGMNKVWESWVAPGIVPARATVESKLATPDTLIEIMVQAII